ncbi:MAG: TadE/TadG family type IV pilus assembly protein [Acidimicrobiia bacterium]|nr:TadE/TadG family type IV pilus assembly protein [Acidimicrobiia bacterium]
MMRSSTQETQRGAVLVEAAILLPLLLMILFVVFDGGRLVFAKIEMTEAVQEGSLWGAYQPSDYAGVRTRVAESLNNPDIFPGDVVVECPPGGDSIRVTLSRDIDLLTPIGSGAVTLTATAEGDLFSDDPCVPSP